MTRHAKVLLRVLRGTSDAAIDFDDLCGLLRRLGFTERRRGGSHRIFVREGVEEILNLQPRTGGEAKPYQVKQVRQMIVRYGLSRQLDEEASSDGE